MNEYFNDTNSLLIFVVGILVTSLFIIGVWELMREGLTGIPGTLSMKIKKNNSNETPGLTSPSLNKTLIKDLTKISDKKSPIQNIFKKNI